MASKTSVSNLALSHLGISKEIAELSTEDSSEASACRRYFDVALEATLSDFPWPFATVIEALALVEEDPNDEWGFSYRYPIGAVKILRILSGIRNDNRQSRVPYKRARDVTGGIIWCDTEDASCEYTYLEEDVSRWPASFQMAFSFRLAGYIVSRVTGGDPFNQANKMKQMYMLEISVAEANAANEQQDEEVPDSQFIRDRS